MGSSLRLFTVRGIAIRVHITFPLIIIWAALQFGYLNGGGMVGALFGIIVIILLFLLVTLHELGHSMAAMRYGVPVEQIVLLPIGGVAQLKRIPENPTQELVIAIAGPAVNFGIAILLTAAAFAFGIQIDNPAAILAGLQRITFESIFGYIFFYNIFLGVFNLLPAFPMDGGRVLRALLASRLEYARATDIAVRIGRSLAWLLGLYGFLGGGFFMILIAFFIYMGAGQEGAAVRSRSILRGLVVAQAFSRNVQSLFPTDTLQAAVDLTLSGAQANFPVCDDGQLVGLLTYPTLVQALNQYGPAKVVSEVMLTDVPSVSSGDGLFEVQQRFQTGQLDALPVVDDDSFLGLITARDLNEVFRLVTVNPDLLPRANAD